MSSASGALGPGGRLGPYRIERELGGGGMGTVFEAVDETLGRRVALKVIAPELAGEPAFGVRFTREAQAQASLDSPHVVQVFAHGEVDGRLYLATQLIPDGDLGRALRRHGPLPPPTALEVLAQVAAGLSEAHRAGLVHRDIKPGNVLLRNRGAEVSAYLADFGIACRAGAVAGGDVGVGTPAYMAPELLHGGAGDVASDLYALGCVLWVALTGRPPYAGTTDRELAEAHRGAPIPQLAERSRFERDLNGLLHRLLAEDPRDRPTSADVVVAELRSLAARADARPIGRPGWFGRTGRIGRTARHGMVGVGALVLIGVVVAAVLLVGRGGHDGHGDGTSSVRDAVVDRVAAELAARLESDGGLDARAARCAARRVVREHGVEDLRRAGLLDADLRVVLPRGSRLDGTVLSEVFAASARCLWPVGEPPGSG